LLRFTCAEAITKSNTVANSNRYLILEILKGCIQN
jgi:hypothetical protein